MVKFWLESNTALLKRESGTNKLIMNFIDLIESQSMPKCLDKGIRVCEWQVPAQEHPSALYGVPENKKSARGGWT
jgi:hypothetical protein